MAGGSEDQAVVCRRLGVPLDVMVSVVRGAVAVAEATDLRFPHQLPHDLRRRLAIVRMDEFHEGYREQVGRFVAQDLGARRV